MFWLSAPLIAWLLWIQDADPNSENKNSELERAERVESQDQDEKSTTSDDEAQEKKSSAEDGEKDKSLDSPQDSADQSTKPDSEGAVSKETKKVGKEGLKVHKGPSPLTRRVARWEQGVTYQIVSQKGPWSEVKSGEIQGFALTGDPSSQGLGSSRFVTATTTALASKGLGEEWARKNGTPRAELLSILIKRRFTAAELRRFQNKLRPGQNRRDSSEENSR